MSSFIDERRQRFGVTPICQALEVSASAYYERRTGRRSARAIEDAHLLKLITEVHAANYSAYGYRRTWKALLRAGEDVGRDRIRRLMREVGIEGAKRRGKPWRTTKPDPSARRSPDLVERDFTAAGPDRLWVADLTYLRSWEGMSFLAFVIDAWSRRIVGWQLAAHMRTTLVLDALRMALGTRSLGADVELVHHSDRGSQPGLNRSSQQCVDASECRAVTRLSARRRERSERRSGDSRGRAFYPGPTAFTRPPPGNRPASLPASASPASCAAGR